MALLKDTHINTSLSVEPVVANYWRIMKVDVCKERHEMKVDICLYLNSSMGKKVRTKSFKFTIDHTEWNGNLWQLAYSKIIAAYVNPDCEIQDKSLLGAENA